MGNVLSVITPDASDATQPAIGSLTDYYPFGMEEPGRKYSAEDYRYGFNTQEKVQELGAGHTTALYWEYDGRLGRRWNMDPVIKPIQSFYCTYSDNPINRIDFNGDDDFFNSEGYFIFHTETEYNYIRVMNDEEIDQYYTGKVIDLNSVQTISSFDYSDEQSSASRMLFSIVKYYTDLYNFQTISHHFCEVEEKDMTAAAMTCADDKQIQLTTYQGHINDCNNISDQLLSTLFHEGIHTTQDLENYNPLYETDPIIGQMRWQDENGAKVTQDYTNGLTGYFQSCMERYYRKYVKKGRGSLQDIRECIDKFNAYVGYECMSIDDNGEISNILDEVVVSGE